MRVLLLALIFAVSVQTTHNAHAASAQSRDDDDDGGDEGGGGGNGESDAKGQVNTITDKRGVPQANFANGCSRKRASCSSLRRATAM